MHVQSSPTDMLVAAIKQGELENAKSLIAQFPQAVDGADMQDGASPLHWAALFGNAHLVEHIIKSGGRADAVIAASGMMALHWASTRGHVDVVKLLIQSGCDINAVDIKKTTALVIAAQYDHTVLVFFLVKEGADISLVDDCNDSALHWAAYKGNLQTAALLHYLGLPADAVDSYGSTPLHLAAARNAPHVIELLIDESSNSIERLVQIKDARGRTPVDVAMERGNLMAVRLLKKINPPCRTKLLLAVMGNDGSKILWYFYMANACIAYMVYAFHFAPAITNALPAIAQLQHVAYACINVLMQFCYIWVHCKEPGDVGGSDSGCRAYEEALAAAANGTMTDSVSMPLCHTCRIVKPLRSKHCSVRKRCVPMFDHHCPYINNTIGGGNYMSFIAFISTGLWGVGFTFAASVQFLYFVSSRSLLAWLMAVDFCFVTLMAIAMNNYHASLIVRNLTTNEDMNKHRYHYLKDDLNQFRNPFSRGPLGNVAEFCSRSSRIRSNPYIHTEMYRKFVRCNGSELEGFSESGSLSDSGCDFEYDDRASSGGALLWHPRHGEKYCDPAYRINACTGMHDCVRRRACV